MNSHALIGLLVLATVALAIVGLNITTRRMLRDGNWHANGANMRRHVNGRWQYRAMTTQEAIEWQDSMTW